MAANPKSTVMTLAEFEEFAALPANRDRRLEFIDGEMIELVSNEISGHLTLLLSSLITIYVTQHDLGYTTSAESGFRIGNNDFIPDCAFIAKATREKPIGETWITVVPDLVVEVKSPTDSFSGLVNKVGHYLAAGVKQVWVVLPDKRRLDVYTQDDHHSFTVGETVTGGDVLPGFALHIADLFAKLS
ncbi:MAG: Uma2 family endonuclease [Anaerolineae bacterium]|nr:Uma2 family endonuclease [Anaerolineae bacterium]